MESSSDPRRSSGPSRARQSRVRRLNFAIESSMIDDSQLVEKLAKTDAVSNRDLRSGLDFAKEDGTSLYEALITHELVDERLLVKIVARLLNVPPVWLGDRTPDADVTGCIPRSLAVRNRVLPLKRERSADGQRLVVAMIDPLDVLAMDEVASHTGVDIRPVFAGPYDLRGGLERAYGAAAVEQADEAASLEALEEAASEEFEPDEDLLDEELDKELDDGLTDDSWASFFDAAEDVDNTEDSSVISRDMKDRAISSVLDAVDPDHESEDDADEDEDDADEDGLNSLDEPLSKSQMTGGVEPDLDGWEVDAALDGEEDEQSQKNRDYAKIGHLFVYSPEKAAAQSEAEEVDPDSGKKKSDKKKSDKKKSDKKKSGKKKSDTEKSDTEKSDTEKSDTEKSDTKESGKKAPKHEPPAAAKPPGEAERSISVSEPSELPEPSEPSGPSLPPGMMTDDSAEFEEDSEADDDSDTFANTEFGLGPAALRDEFSEDEAEDEPLDAEPSADNSAEKLRKPQSTNKNPAVVKDKLREMSSEAELNGRFVDKLDALCDLDDASRKALGDASPTELIYAAVLSLVDAEVLDPSELLEYLPKS